MGQDYAEYLLGEEDSGKAKKKARKSKSKAVVTGSVGIMERMALPLCQLPLAVASSSSRIPTVPILYFHHQLLRYPLPLHYLRGCRPRSGAVVLVSKEETTSTQEDEQRDEFEEPPEPVDLEYVRQIKNVLELLKKNRDMLFSEVKLTVMIEDPREVERRRLLGIEDPDAPTRDDLVTALEEVNEGKVPEDRVALKMLAEELTQWPNLEVEAPKTKPRKSLYAKATDTGIDPKEAAKRLNLDWDSAAEIEESDVKDETEVPPAVGYGALYLVTAFPVIIGISVVLILFFNSLQ